MPSVAPHCVDRSGWRWADPWWDSWSQNVRGKWVGRRVIDVLVSELPVTESTIRHAFHHGLVTLQATLRAAPMVVSPGHSLRLNEVLHYKFHRHEPAVPATNTKVLHSDTEIAVVSKPAGHPVHPIGRFNRCSVLGQLQLLHPELGELRPTHRLDRLVSGCLIFARTKDSAKQLTDAFRSRDVKKEYVARVTSSLPSSPLTVNSPVGRVSGSADAPVFGVVPEVDGGKPATTVLENTGVSFPDGTCLVRCYPETGRTHQIRVHLASVGCPIANDNKYRDVSMAATPLGLPPLPPRPLFVKDPRCLECFVAEDQLWGDHVTDYDRRAGEIWLHAVRYKLPHALLRPPKRTAGGSEAGAARKRRKREASTSMPEMEDPDDMVQPDEVSSTDITEWSTPLPPWAIPAV